MRKILATLFGLAAFLVAAGYAVVLSQHESLPPLVHFFDIPFAALAAVTAFYLFRSPAAWQASMGCPSCHQRGTLTLGGLGQPHPSVLALLLGGIILTLLIQHSQRRRFSCTACSAETRTRPFGSWLALAWCLFFFVYLIAWILAQ